MNPYQVFPNVLPVASARKAGGFLVLIRLFAGLILGVGPVQGMAGDVITRGAAPGWADLLEPDLSPLTSKEEEGTGGSFTLLYDQQVHLPSEAWLFHEATLLQNSAGVDASSRLQVWFDPAYQQFALHRLRVHRDGEVIDLTERQPFRVRERERSMEWNLYNGQLSAEALLEDIRPGDVVEWVYSLQGHNPIFGGRTHVSFGLSSNIPMRRYRVRVLLPEENPGRFEARPYSGTPPEWVRREGAVVEADMRDMEPSPTYQDAPSWYWPFPGFSVSDYSSWAEVVEWALPLYRIPEPLPDMLRGPVAHMNGLPTEEAKILYALRYAQDTLRYVSIHAGLHSHKPYPVEDVLRRRFGDCKDKAVLMITLLRAAGIEAYPALVHTRLRQTIAEHLPSPLWFDHVIVGIPGADGDVIWLDPTDSHQRGPLNTVFVPAYGKILWIRPGETDLRKMTGAGFDASRVHVTERYVLPQQAEEPVRLYVTTHFEGMEAEIIRAQLASTSLRDLQDTFQDHYAKLHQSARPEGLPSVEDREDINRVTLLETWVLDDPWKTGNGERLPYLEFEPYFVNLLNHVPASLRLGRYFALAHPKHVKHDIEIEFPFYTEFELSEFERATEDFRFRFHETQTGNTLVLSYLFETYRDHVPPDRLAEYKQVMEECWNWGSYWVANPWAHQALEEGPARFLPNYPLIGFGILLWGIFLFGTLSFGHRPPPPPADLDGAHPPPLPPMRIGGWLILPILSLCFGIAHRLLNLVNEMYWDYDMDVWQSLTSPASEAYHPLWAPLFFLGLFDLAWGFGAFPAHLIVIFRRKARAKTLFFLFYAILLSIVTSQFLLIRGLEGHMEPGRRFEALGQVIGAVIVCSVWIPYFLNSVRVKRTFVR
ncbi:MAG: DUF3857 domain-containing protein [Verrucomicrobia bacterium]|nr:DUF3857 domain-containing protein [Verrucomicrobiota bacterium]MCH8527990.1 DUF3857 domain-containing protein [Kiritimatiellia bacterium]